MAILNGVASTVTTANYILTSAPNYYSGFGPGGALTLNNGAALQGTMLQLTNGQGPQATSAFFSQPVHINSFVSQFAFQLLNASGDGFTFTIQNNTPTIVGPAGGALGYGQGVGLPGSIPNSIALKFDLYNNSGEGSNSIGLYLDGAAPILPAVSLDGTGINLHSGHTFLANMNYDGSSLTLTLNDTNTGASFTKAFPVNIAQAVGGTSAYVGFTAGTYGATAVQNILGWTYQSDTATPVFSPGAGTYSSAQQVTITDAAPGAVIYYTTNGFTPTTNSPVYSGPVTITGDQTLQAIAVATGSASPITTAVYTIAANPFYSGGFTSGSGITLNGGSAILGNLLQLTNGSGIQATSAFYSAPVAVGSFATDFTFQLLNPNGDGFAFVIQADGADAVGPPGGALGYGAGTGAAGSLANSVALKFDLYNNAGEGPDSTGLYLNGASPTQPSINLSGSGIDLHSGDVFRAHVNYDGTTLTLTLTDAYTGASFTQPFALNIPQVIGTGTAYVGFTAGTYGATATQNILSWTYTPTTPHPTSQVLSVVVPGPSLVGNLIGDAPNRAATVYLPPSYEASSTKQYPVVYFLHGYGENDSEWFTNNNLQQTIDAAIQAGTMQEMIVVIPNAETLLGGSFYSNSIATGRWEDFIWKDLVSYMDSNYRTIPAAASRGLGGYSMGGYGVFEVGFRHPDVFANLYAISPCCSAWLDDFTQNSPYIVGEQTLQTTIDFVNANPGVQLIAAIDAAWAPDASNPPFYADKPYVNGQVVPSVIAEWQTNLPVENLQSYLPNIAKLQSLGFDAGIEDEFAHIPDTVRLLDAELTAIGIPHFAELFVGDHTDQTYNRLTNKLLPFFSTNLSNVVPAGSGTTPGGGAGATASTPQK